MSAARFRRNYADDATLEDRVFELLETCFPGIGNRRRALTRGVTRGRDNRNDLGRLRLRSLFLERQTVFHEARGR